MLISPFSKKKILKLGCQLRQIFIISQKVNAMILSMK